MRKTGTYSPQRQAPTGASHTRSQSTSAAHHHGNASPSGTQSSLPPSLQTELLVGDATSSSREPGTSDVFAVEPRPPLFSRQGYGSLPAACGQARRRHDRCPSAGQAASTQSDESNDVFVIYSNQDAGVAQGVVASMEKAGLTCVDFNRDFSLGESLLDQLSSFLFNARRTLFFLSKDFLKPSNRLSAYQRQLALRYYLDHDRNGIVVLLIEECDVSTDFSVFPIIEGSKENWLPDLVWELRTPVSKMKNPCFDESHISLRSLYGSQRSVMSEPPTLRGRISDRIKTKIKIWHRSRSLMELRQSSCLNTGEPTHSSHPATYAQEDSVIQNEAESVLEPGECSETDSLAARTSKEDGDQSSRPESRDRSSEPRVASNTAFLLQLRQQGARVAEANESYRARKDEELSLQPGDVLQLLEDSPDLCPACHVQAGQENPPARDPSGQRQRAEAGTDATGGQLHPSAPSGACRHQRTSDQRMSRVRNYLDKEGLVPTGILGPCVTMFPSQAIKKLRMPLNAHDSEIFRQGVFALGGRLGQVTQDRPSTDTQHVSAKHEEYVQVIKALGRYSLVRTARNELGYLHTEVIKFVEEM